MADVVVVIEFEIGIRNRFPAVPVNFNGDGTGIIAEAKKQAAVSLCGKSIGDLHFSHLPEGLAVFLIGEEHLRSNGVAIDAHAISMKREPQPVVHAAGLLVFLVQRISIERKRRELMRDGQIKNATIVEICQRHAA